jgi:chemotaxis protein methyltransferase CheR
MREARFSREGDRLVLDRRVRGMVQFKRLDAVRDDLPGEFDLVLCRYLFFTYFTGERLREAAKRLHAALRPGGVLMTGAREDAPRELEDLFTPRPGPGSCFSRRI